MEFTNGENLRCVCVCVCVFTRMQDLAQTVMEQLRIDDGAAPFVVLATWKNWSTMERTDYQVRPITRNGVTSFNVETQTWKCMWLKTTDDVLEVWNPEKLCNYATSMQAARFLMFVATDRHNRAGAKDRPCVRLSIGRFGPDLLNNQMPLDYWEAEPVADLIDMCGSMRPPVEA